MRRALLVPLLALSLSGCGYMQRAATTPGGIAAVAVHTAADEEALKRCEQTYKLSRTIMEIGVDSELIKGTRATQVAKIDMELFGLLIGCRTAYMLFNSPALTQAADEIDLKAGGIAAAIKQGAD